MVMSVRFKVVSKSPSPVGTAIRFQPVADSPVSENLAERFAPWGDITIMASTQDTADRFEVNAEFDFDITPLG